MTDLFLGLDLGTGGARACLVDAQGVLHAEAFSPLPASAVWRGGNGEHEQDPLGWWLATRSALDRIVSVLKGSGRSPDLVRAVAVSSTSGTIALVDGDGAPVGRALMYDDPRGADQAGELNRAGESHLAKFGFRFNASYGLAKLAWLRARDPARLERAARIVHAADFIAGRLTGRYDVTDWTSALKSGYDVVDLAWPAFIGGALRLPADKLPRVVRPGETVGRAEGPGAREAGLVPATLVVAGMTDGCASQLGAGAVAPGAVCASLGTTLILKGVTAEFRRDPRGRVYSHRHPEGLWMPGGASNTGGGALEREFGRPAILLLDERVGSRLPTAGLVYPLAGRGERFPFVRTDLETWWIAPVEDRLERFGAMLEGTAYVERLGCDALRAIGVGIEGPLRTNGGGTQSASWLAVRAAVLNRPVEVPANSSSAFGASVLAAAQSAHPNLAAAAAAMVRPRVRVEPKPEWVQAYEERYGRFHAALKSRGYI
jgi:sugar (pentulose or hexulose) kinase